MNKISIAALLVSVVASAHASDFVMIKREREISPIRSQIHKLDEQINAMAARIDGFETVGTTWVNPCTGLSIAECDRVSAVEISDWAAPDDRPPLWDGAADIETYGPYTRTVQAVDGVHLVDGVPLWDDSVAHYLDHNFEDAFAPYQPYYIGFDANVESQVEEVLTPFAPTTNLWGNGPRDLGFGKSESSQNYAARDLTAVVGKVFGDQDLMLDVDLSACPFEAEHECEIWRKKPMVNETVSPRSANILAGRMTVFLDAIKRNPKLPASDSAAAPFVDRYEMLMRSARACCTDGMVHTLQAAGASDGLIYKFLADDANFYNLGARCLVLSDTDFDEQYPNTATAAMAADVRNGCLCRGRQWYGAMLAPFATAYDAVPEFAKSKFEYTYTDGLGREITTSINGDVQNVLNQLAACP